MLEIIFGIFKELLVVCNKLLDGAAFVFKAVNIACLPSQSDKARYELVMHTIYIHSIYHFRNDENNPFFINRIFDGIEENASYLNGGIYLPSFKNRRLKKKEEKLAKAAKQLFIEIYDNIDMTSNGLGYKIKDTSKDRMIKLDRASAGLIRAFEDFRDCGSKLFASKVAREVING